MTLSLVICAEQFIPHRSCVHLVCAVLRHCRMCNSVCGESGCVVWYGSVRLCVMWYECVTFLCVVLWQLDIACALC